MNDPDKAIFPGFQTNVPRQPEWGDCGCWTCVGALQQARVDLGQIPFPNMPFIVCPDCGNKRCPKATVAFLRDGEDAGAMSAESIIDHNGEVTEGGDLDELIWE